MKSLVNGIAVFSQGSVDSLPIIFIHGFPFDHTLWDDTIAQLKENYHCISYDVRGFGSSDAQCGQYTMESYVDDLEAIIKALGLKSVILCGFSMGGYIALRANERLDNIKALILANTTTTADNDEAKIKRASVIKKIDDGQMESFLDGFFDVAFSKTYLEKNQEIIQSWKRKIASFNPLGIKGGVLAMISRTDTTKSLEDAPSSLFIEASQDEIIPAPTMKNLSKKTPKSQYVQLQKSAHVSMLHEPKEFARALQEFLKEF
jgi:pimeloyl-ACP methyl ester carboxylesterase